MEHRPQLPPITTHFAEFFPRPASHPAPLTPSEDTEQPDRPLKRKRSDPEPVERSSATALEYEPPARRRPTSTYRSSNVGEPDQKRFAPHFSRDHRYTAAESSEPDYARERALTPPRHYSAYDNRPVPSESRHQELKVDRTSHSRGQSTDWLSNVQAPRPQEARVLPPLSRPTSPPQKKPEDRWVNPSRDVPLQYPAPIEPKASYYQIQPEERADTILTGKGAPAEPPRIPPYTNISSAGSTTHSQTSDARRSSISSRQYPLSAIKSPTDTSERSRGLAALQSPPPQRLSRGNPGTHAGFSKSPSDTSPVSARARPGSPQRYTWDAPGLYEHTHRKRRGNLPKESTALLTEWFNKHASYPYPKEAEKQALQAQTGLAMSQISNWFVNARRRRRPLGPSASARTEHSHLQHPSSTRDRDPLHATRYR